MRHRDAAKARARSIAIGGGSLLLATSLCSCAYLPWIHRKGSAGATAQSTTTDSLQVVGVESSSQPARSAPFAIALGPDQAIWFGEFLTNDIGRISPLGQVKLLRVKDGGIAERMAKGPDDAIWFTDPSSNRIGRINRDGDVAFVRLLMDNAGPAGITLGPDATRNRRRICVTARRRSRWYRDGRRRPGLFRGEQRQSDWADRARRRDRRISTAASGERPQQHCGRPRR